MALFFEHEIPGYLRISPHYLQIVSDEPFPVHGLEFPFDCVKKDGQVNSLDDVVELLQTLRYWLLPDLVESSVDLVKFCFENAHSAALIKTFREFQTEFPFLRKLLLVATDHSLQRMNTAVRQNNVTLIKYLYEVDHMPVDETAGRIAAAAGHLECLNYLQCAGLPLTHILVAESIIYDKTHVLQYLIDHGAELKPASIVLGADRGRLDCLKLLVDGNCPTDDLAEAFLLASRKGYLSCVEYMWKNCNLSGDICFEGCILRGATEGGQLSIFKFTFENNFPSACYPTCLGSLLVEGMFDCIEYLKSMGVTM